MASVKLALSVPADYIGYTAMKMVLQEIADRAKDEPFNASWEEAGALADAALAFVVKTETPEC